MKRRGFLYAVVGSAGLTAGCITDESGEQSSPVATESPTPTTPCGGGLDRVDSSADEIRYDSLGGFKLTASKTSVTLGDSITFRLKNTSKEQHTTGNRRKYDIQQRTDDEWQSIYWASGPVTFTDEGIILPPDDKFTWEFTLSQEGLQHAKQSNYSVCESPSPGDYRFVYWGVIPPQEEASNSEDEYAISTRFTVTE